LGITQSIFNAKHEQVALTGKLNVPSSNAKSPARRSFVRINGPIRPTLARAVLVLMGFQPAGGIHDIRFAVYELAGITQIVNHKS